MNRKEFIKTCGLSCLSVVGLSTVLGSCAPTKYIQGQMTGNRLMVSKTDFLKDKNGSKKNRLYVIVKIESLSYPIVVFRATDSDYVALLLQCPHQNMELNVNGDLITCPAHGSEFNNKGEVTQGPAEQGLKNYHITQDTENIFIHLA